MNYLETLLAMMKSTLLGLFTFVGSWVSVIGGTFLAQTAPGDPTASLIEFIITKNSSTLGVAGVLALVVWYQQRDREITQKRHEAEKTEMKADYEKRIAKLEAKSEEMERYIRKRQSGIRPEEITTKITRNKRTGAISFPEDESDTQ